MDEIIQAILAQHMQPTQIQVDEMQPAAMAGGMGAIGAAGQDVGKGPQIPGSDIITQLADMMTAQKQLGK